MTLGPCDEKAAMNGAGFVPRIVAGLVMKPVGFLQDDSNSNVNASCSSAHVMPHKQTEREETVPLAIDLLAYLVELR
jgi:hypothetical protein